MDANIAAVQYLAENYTYTFVTCCVLIYYFYVSIWYNYEKTQYPPQEKYVSALAAAFLAVSPTFITCIVLLYFPIIIIVIVCFATLTTAIFVPIYLILYAIDYFTLAVKN